MAEQHRWPGPAHLILAFLASAFSGLIGVTMIGMIAPPFLTNAACYDCRPEGVLNTVLFALAGVAVQTLLLAVPLFFLLRNRIAFSRRNALLIGALCAALPSMAVNVFQRPGPEGLVDWALTVVSPLVVVLLPLGALCGWLFWSMVASAPRRP